MTKQTALSIGDVTAKFPPEVLSRYDFTTAVYTGALKPITGIVCAEHGEFQQYAAQLRKGGAGCPQCGHDERGRNKRVTQEQAIALATAKHDGFYSYERTVYTIGQAKFTVTCPYHGDFDVLAFNHIYGGRGCPTCGAAKRGHRKDVAGSARKTADARIARAKAAFEEQSRALNGDLYDYSQVDYQTRRLPVTLVCRKHGPFQQTPMHHLYRAHGCPECSHHRSKGEAEIVEFVSIFAKPLTRDRSIIAPKELDIYLPDHGLAIEYCGEYWHAASSLEEERKDRTRHLDKFRACEAKGIRLLTVYESEWLARPDVIKRLIRNALGKGRGRLMARKCELRRVGPVPAYDFFEAYHPQGGGGGGDHYGLYYADRLVACMRFTWGGNDRGRGAERVWTLSRYATRIAVTGGASRLLSAFLDEYDPPLVKSFSDNRYFTGTMYERLGFELEEESLPDYQVYHPRIGLRPKAAWQRRKIPARIRDVGSKEKFDPVTDPRSETTMTYLLGAQRMFDCGKKRWVWRKQEAG